MPITLVKAATSAQQAPFPAPLVKRGRGRPRIHPANTPRPPRRSGHATIKPPIVPIDQPCRLSAGNVCAIGGISIPKLNRMIAEGSIPAPKYDGRRRWWPSHEVRAAFGL